jgi:uncharacterized cupin superfamily protein
MTHVILSDDLPWIEWREGEHFAVRTRRLGAAAGGRALACSLCEIDPGKTAWPFHRHLVNEEAIYVLAGRATLRLGARQLPLREGDYVALPPGEDLAHQITNTGDAPFRYLCMSTMHEPDVVYYPDSRKVGVIGEGDGVPFGFFPESAAVDYWHGEPVGEQEAPLADQIDEQLDQLREKLAGRPSSSREKSFRERVQAKVEELGRTVRDRLAGTDTSADEAAIEREIDEEIERLKKKLNITRPPHDDET